MIDKSAMLEKIRLNIAEHGHHINLILGGTSPRFAYTIGVNQKVGVELILAGALFYSVDDVHRIINDIVVELRAGTAWKELNIKVDSLGIFSLRRVDASWSDMMILGALDFYNTSEISALQIIPDQVHWTIDIPNLTKQWNAISEPVWQWLNEKWKYPVPEQSTAVTNLDALQGEPITEAVRWEEDQWELFAGAGPDVAKENIRVVSLGTLLGADQSLYPITNLDVGKGLWRDSTELKWHSWGK
ncbi:MAG: DUF4262 domain-containing protein [Candidatus Parabeggiatoa sp.]|nr:DUF4262 domain-containing protein [Candidatus Parabeggiatoa sp.]HIE02779.1 DUF4262 domain-containing protein [Thiotrichaceae bacterium]